MSKYHPFRELELSGIDLIEVLAGDGPSQGLSIEQQKRVDETLAQSKHPAVDLIYLLTHMRFGRAKSAQLWDSILAHKEELEKKLGRAVGARVAAHDYLTNVEHLIKRPTVIPGDDFSRLLESVHIDDLTQVYNRGQLKASLQHEIGRARRYNQTLSIMMIDVDYLKKINDEHGHLAGDQVLAKIGEILGGMFRRSDTVGRYGGDEFMVLLPGTSRQDAETLAKRTLAVAAETLVRVGTNGHRRDICFSLSIGLANYPEDATQLQDLLGLADAAMYGSKASGRNAVRTSDPKLVPGNTSLEPTAKDSD